FLEVVRRDWKCECEGYQMYKLVQKIKRIKVPLNNIAWKKRKLFLHVKKIEEDLKSVQVEVEANPNCKVVKEKLSKIRQEYNEATNDEEKLLAQKAKVKWLSEGDKNTKYFHNVIKSRMHTNRIKGVCDEKGNCCEEESVADQFVKHFEKFLGNRGETEQIDSPEDLFLNKFYADLMVRDITDKEIKEAIFGIGDDKAPGPDGYTAKFWNIVGGDVCGAVQEFFKSNKLLGEVNATLITLIPNIHQPNKVSDYRPIACCNVVYKCISKIITKRLQGCLDKLVNVNQSAFVPERLIQDNLLITQELLKGYNRKNGPKRYALKIDIAKAYDIVNWGFLKRILTHFGFHEKIIGWIVTCVTSVAFSIGVNGERYGYFKSGRGLRQGDLMSPYLFTLFMEVLTLIVQSRVNRSDQFKFHWGCKELKLTQLCFADDLLMLCNGDHISVKVLKDVLMEFSKVSGLIPNMQKSTIFFRSVKENEKQRILEVMPFAVGTLPMKYLRVPLITNNIGVSECNQLASVFLIPKATVKDIEKVLKGFMWCQRDFKRGAAKVSWKDICTPKVKEVWESRDWGLEMRLFYRSIWEIDIEDSDSGTWKVMLNLCSIRESEKYEARVDEKSNVADMIVNREWAWPNEWKTMYRCINDIKVPVLSITAKMRKRKWDSKWDKAAYTIAKDGCKNTIYIVLNRMAFATVIYFIWNERNKRIFAQEQRSYHHRKMYHKEGGQHCRRVKGLGEHGMVTGIGIANVPLSNL
ncbi:RNA-directed DNA polymerase, eukaryota, reverse transcriptase zinc-binding domain protein, partial [Tanacetum coccineum]